MAEFKFPKGEAGAKVVAPNGIVYLWDATNGRWGVSSNIQFDPNAYATKSYVDDKFQESMPIGSIIFWGGTRDKIPSGWKECDGSSAPSGVKNFTGMDKLPDLREYMPAGAGGKFGTNVGDKSDSRLKRHKHKWAGPEDRKGYPTKSADMSEGSKVNQSYWRGNKYSNTSTTYGAEYTTETGDNFTCPPVYMGIYIMKVV